MFNTISTLLQNLGFNSTNRALLLHLSDHELNNKVDIQRIEVFHEINQGLSAELICMSTDPFIELKSFIGCNVAVDQITDKGQYNRVSGLVIGASIGQSDGGLTVYRLEISDATYLLKKRINSRVFMNKTVLQIVEILFNEWSNKSKVFASSLKLSLKNVELERYDTRPFIMQFCESDFHFLSRLLREEGINFLIDEKEYLLTTSQNNIEPQFFRLIDDNRHFQCLKRKNIRYHRSDATEYFDTITSLISNRKLAATVSHIQRWHSQTYSHQEGAGKIFSKHKNSAQYTNEQLNLEQSMLISPAWIGDFEQKDHVTPSSNRQVDRLNQQLIDYEDLNAKCFIAYGSVRDAQVGYYFELNEHPEIDQQHKNAKEFLILSKYSYNQNNFPKDISEQLERLLSLNHWLKDKDSIEERQACQLTLVRRDIKIVPKYDPMGEKPLARIMRAKVVGPEGEVVHTDQEGRVKVQFLFSRKEDNTHDSGAGSNQNNADSAWLETMTPWAYSDGGGISFLPRVGEEVFVDFVHGDIDRPFILGRLHESEHKPVKFDKKSILPDSKSLSGIRSNEFAGDGYGQLRFDDTEGQISTQLQSSFGATQLNLGNLSHPKTGAESEGRGEGFELRSDEYGAIRAAKGILLTTQSAINAAGNQLDRSELQQLLEVHKKNNEALLKLVKGHVTTEPELDLQEKIVTDLEAWDGSDSNPYVLLNAKDSIVANSQQGIVLQAQNHVDITTPRSVQLFSGRNFLANALNKISLFSKQGGMNIKAGGGDLNIEAQSGNMKIAAQEKFHIYNLNDLLKIESGKGILITCGGGYIKIQDGNIEVVCPGLLKLKGAQTQVISGGSMAAELGDLPSMDMEYNERFVLKDRLGQAMPNMKYKIETEDGKVIEGVTDTDGHTEDVNSLSMNKAKLTVLGPAAE